MKVVLEQGNRFTCEPARQMLQSKPGIFGEKFNEAGRAVCLLCCVFGLFQTVSAQGNSPKKLAIYAPNETFSLNLLEKQLLSLKDKHTDSTLFKNGELVNINDLMAAYQNQSKSALALKQLLLSQPSQIDKATLAQLGDVGQQIRQYQQFLQVNTNSFQGFIEYQLLLYSIVKEDEAHQNNIIDVSSKKFTTRIFRTDIDVESLQQILSDALKDLFIQAHAIPDAIINVDQARLNGHFSQKQKRVDVALSDTVFLDAYFSKDKDTPKGHLRYQWKELLASGAVTDIDLRLVDQGITCLAIPQKTGEFDVQLSLSDGVDMTAQTEYGRAARDTIRLIVHARPSLQLLPNRVKSHYVENLTKNALIAHPAERIVLKCSAPIASTETVEPGLELLESDVQDSDVRGYPLNVYFDAIQVKFPNTKTDKWVSVRCRHDHDIYSSAQLRLVHKVYSPYAVGISWAQNELKINPQLNITGDVTAWNEPRLFFYMKVVKSLDIGIGWAIKSQKWLNGAGEKYQLHALGEVEACWTALSSKAGDIGLVGFAKLFQAEEPNTSYSVFSGGLKCQLNMNLFQGMSVLSFNVNIVSSTFDNNFIADYSQWWGLGIKTYIPSN